VINKKSLKLITETTKNRTLLVCGNKENGYVQFITVHHANDSTHHSNGHFRDKTFQVINCNHSKNKIHNNQKIHQLECGPMPNLMVALPNIGGPLCSMPQSLADAHY